MATLPSAMTAWHLAKPACFPIAKINALSKANVFVECEGKYTRKRLPICRVLVSKHSANYHSRMARHASLPSVIVK